MDIQALWQELMLTLTGCPVTLRLSQQDHVSLKTTTILTDVAITQDQQLQFTLDNGCMLVCVPSLLEKNKYGDWVSSHGYVTVVLHRL